MANLATDIVGRLASGLRLRRPALRRAMASQPTLLAALTVVAAFYTVAAVLERAWFPVATVCVWVLLGGFFLRLRFLLVYFAVLALAVALAVRLRAAPTVQPGVVIALLATGGLVLLYARSRERVGVQGTLGETMLVDLRDRLRAQSTIPPLGPGWHVETVLRSAYGDSFSGDFLVASRAGDGSWAEIILVDVSGKGHAAGTRALLLSGAFGGLVGALPRGDFLPAANRYLLRQDWDEGFATAVQLAVDPCSGAFEVRSAGHPPAARFDAGSGRWEIMAEGRGPLLGVLPDPDFPAQTGVLGPGDAVLLYTDGLVEDRAQDIGQGIDRLVGAAERALPGGFDGGAARIVANTRAGTGDDRALVLLWRS